MTVGVYGLVAAIVKLDDGGLYLSQRGNVAMRAFGCMLLAAAPKLMKMLMVISTAAMFLVGGRILVHGVPAIHPIVEAATQTAAGGHAEYTHSAAIDGLAGIVRVRWC